MNKEIMKKLSLLFVLVAVMLASCSPKVTVNLIESLPARQVDSVIVYEQNEPLPAGARKIGTVKATDPGFTPTENCMYSNMLSLAVRKTAECGGNALHVDEHRLPNIWTSTCHRVYGTMYVVPDSAVTIDTYTALQKAEMDNDVELVEFMREQNRRRERSRANPKNVLRVDLGYGDISSRFVVDGDEYEHKGGFTVNAGYMHYWSWFGVGAEVMNYSTTFDDLYHLNLFYVGPSLGLSFKSGERWRWDYNLGVGYGVYKESLSGYSIYSYTEKHATMKCDMGVEYMLSKNVGLGVRVNFMSMRLNKPEGFELKKDEFYGIQRADFIGGLRVYF